MLQFVGSSALQNSLRRVLPAVFGTRGVSVMDPIGAFVLVGWFQVFAREDARGAVPTKKQRTLGPTNKRIHTACMNRKKKTGWSEHRPLRLQLARG